MEFGGPGEGLIYLGNDSMSAWDAPQFVIGRSGNGGDANGAGKRLICACRERISNRAVRDAFVFLKSHCSSGNLVFENGQIGFP